MKIGDKIRKPKGYAFNGTIRSVFENSKGETRIVAELDGNGMLHIFSPSQLELREESFTSVRSEEAAQWGLIEDVYKLRQEEQDNFSSWVSNNFEKGDDRLYRNRKFEMKNGLTIEELWREYNKATLIKAREMLQRVFTLDNEVLNK